MQAKIDALEKDHHNLDKRVVVLENNGLHLVSVLEKICATLESSEKAFKQHMDDETALKWRFLMALLSGAGFALLGLIGFLWSIRSAFIGG